MSVRDSAIFEAISNVSKDLDDLEEFGQSGDSRFLQSVLDNDALISLLRVNDVLTTPRSRPVDYAASRLVQDVSEALLPLAAGTGSRRSSGNIELVSAANDLLDILGLHNVLGTIDAHDTIAHESSLDKYGEGHQQPLSKQSDEDSFFKTRKEPDIKMVQIKRNSPNERLGLTVKRENNQLVVARIIAGSLADKQGILQKGDVILELNGRTVETPSQLESLVREAASSGGDLLFKVDLSDRSTAPNTKLQNNPENQVDGPLPESESAKVEGTFVRAHFSYQPARDNLLPCQTVGLEFRDGDVLEILRKQDSNWWQARKVGENENVGFIPSQQLEERRKAWVKPEWDMTKSSWLCGLATRRRKKKLMFVVRRNADLEPTDIPIYEEVALLPPFHRKLLVLVGASGVGKRTLKNRLIETQPTRFSLALPSTSRPPEPDEVRDPNSPDAEFRFTTRAEMESDIVQNRYAEWGEFRGHLYGISLESIRTVIQSGKTCVVDLNPHALKAVRTSEFLPYVVFVAAPSAEILRNMHEQSRLDGLTTRDKSEEDFGRTVRESAKLERQYRQYFDKVVINDNMSAAFDRLLDVVDVITTQHQWVPVQWIY